MVSDSKAMVGWGQRRGLIGKRWCRVSWLDLDFLSVKRAHPRKLRSAAGSAFCRGCHSLAVRYGGGFTADARVSIRPNSGNLVVGIAGRDSQFGGFHQ